MKRFLLATVAGAFLALPALAQTATTVPPAAKPMPAAPAPAAPPSTTMPAPAASMPMGEHQFTSEAAAKATCPSDTIVWVNLRSHKYHMSGERAYANTKKGAYMCQKDADAAGMKQAGTGAAKKKANTAKS